MGAGRIALLWRMLSRLTSPAPRRKRPAEAGSQRRQNAQGQSSQTHRKTDGRGAGAGAAAGAAGRAAEPSADYQESLRQDGRKASPAPRSAATERRRCGGAVGAIVPWPMPPALIIRHTREVHGEVGSLLYGLRR